MTDYTKTPLQNGSTILVPSHDHIYYPSSVTATKAVFNSRYYSWSEYVGDEYLEEGDEVHTVWVAG